ncbi:MAG TPA: HAD family hydrolase [Chroococcales cyanobacterium]
MQTHCQTPGRNFCAPSGKVAALFVDLDGTIIECQPNFDNAKERFVHLMVMCGFDRKRATQVMKECELHTAKTAGFERENFGKAIIAAYSQLCKEAKRRRNRQILGICEDIGNSPFFRMPKVFPNAAAVLGRAHRKFLIIAVSIGNREAQKYKIRQGGLDPVFDRILITPNDNKVELVQAAIEDLNIDPEFSAFIGNSLRSDGASLAVTNFVHLPLESGWEYDVAELPGGGKFRKFDARDWRDAEEKAIERLIRRREMALENGSTRSEEHAARGC